MRQRVAALALAACAAAEPALAIPAFARRYQVECHFCHDIFPKLNAIGQRFKERGFRMEREDTFDASKWIRTAPFVVRGGATRGFFESADDATTGFLKGISAGNLGTRFSYWVDDSLRFQERRRPRDKRVTHERPDNLWVRFEVVPGGKLYARAGRLELDLPFSEARSPHLFGYDVYFANSGFETDNIGDFQDGLELGGALPKDVRWSAAVVKGRNNALAEELSDQAGQFDANLFLRASKRVDRHRFGAFAYVGRNTLALAPEVVWDDDILRVGGDASLWLRRLNVYGVYVYGRNDNSVATLARPRGTDERLTFSGGFVQADYHVREEVALTLRLNVVSRPPGTTSLANETFSSLYPGIQLWPFPHLKLSFEYGFQNQRRPSLGAFQIEVTI